jgi:hypothetical protein
LKGLDAAKGGSEAEQSSLVYDKVVSGADAGQRAGSFTVGLKVDDLLAEDRVVQFGRPPLRIDLMTSLDGVGFEDAYERRETVDLDGLSVPFIALEDLRRNKQATGRAQDLADLEALDGG